MAQLRPPLKTHHTGPGWHYAHHGPCTKRCTDWYDGIPGEPCEGDGKCEALIGWGYLPNVEVKE